MLKRSVSRQVAGILGNQTVYGYGSSWGELKRITGAPVPVHGGTTESPVTNITYDSFGLVRDVTDPQGRITRHTYHPDWTLKRVMVD